MIWIKSTRGKHIIQLPSLKQLERVEGGGGGGRESRVANWVRGPSSKGAGKRNKTVKRDIDSPPNKRYWGPGTGKNNKSKGWKTLASMMPGEEMGQRRGHF